jgi:hypothetical protein
MWNDSYVVLVQIMQISVRTSAKVHKVITAKLPVPKQGLPCHRSFSPRRPGISVRPIRVALRPPAPHIADATWNYSVILRDEKRHLAILIGQWNLSLPASVLFKQPATSDQMAALIDTQQTSPLPIAVWLQQRVSSVPTLSVCPVFLHYQYRQIKNFKGAFNTNITFCFCKKPTIL